MTLMRGNEPEFKTWSQLAAVFTVDAQRLPGERFHRAKGAVLPEHANVGNGRRPDGENVEVHRRHVVLQAQNVGLEQEWPGADVEYFEAGKFAAEQRLHLRHGLVGLVDEGRQFTGNPSAMPLVEAEKSNEAGDV